MPQFNAWANSDSFSLASYDLDGFRLDDLDAIADTRGYIALSSRYEYSDNINQQSQNQLRGSDQQSTLNLAYFATRPSTNIALNYSLNDYHYYHNYQVDTRNWSGYASLNQQFFANKLNLGINHLRYRYLLNEGGNNLQINQGDKDTLSLISNLQIPYTIRVGMDLGYRFEDLDYSVDAQQDSERHTTDLGWYYQLNKKSQIQLNSTFHQVSFPLSGRGYDQINADLQVSSQLLQGSYLASIGYSHVLHSEEDGFTFAFDYNYKFTRQAISASAKRALTDSSYGLALGNSSTGAVNTKVAQLLWIDYVELVHQYNFNGRGFNNRINVFFESETANLTLLQNNDKDTTQKYGIANYITLPIGKRFTTNLILQYQNIGLQDGDHKHQFELGLNNTYLLHKFISISCAANYLNVDIKQRNEQYDEWRYSTEITLKY